MGSIGETNKLGFANGFHGRAGQSIPGFMYQTYHVGVSNSALNTTFSVYLKQPVIRENEKSYEAFGRNYSNAGETVYMWFVENLAIYRTNI